MTVDKKTDAWMPLWIGAYLADTMTLTTQQHGAYLLLLFAYWRNRGPLADDDQDLASIVKASPDEWISLRKKLERFFSIEAGAWRHKRADDELKKAQEGRAKASEKASKAAAAKWEKARMKAEADAKSNAPSSAQAVLKQCPTPSPTSLPTVEKKVSKASPSHPPAGGKGARFVEFWTAWPKSERKQDRAKCWEHWRAKDLDAIADTILADVRVKRGTTKWSEGYIEAPLVYLRGRRWEDGVEPDGGNPGEAVAPWHDSVKGVVAKGIELGVGGWTQTEWEAGKAPAYPAYRARVLRAAGVEPRRAA